MPPRYFGSDVQQRMQKIARDLSPLVQDNPDYGLEGRMWGIDAPVLSDVDRVAALARLQGATITHYVPKSRETQYAQSYAAQGLANDRSDQFMGGPACLETSAAFLDTFQLPDGYRLHHLSPATPDHILDGLDQTAASCGVLPPRTPVLFGEARKAAYFCLEAPDGGVAACAGACMRNHPDSRFAKTSWWGMLATRDQDRGQKLSLYLGALAARKMYETYGVEEFYTGVRSENAVSRHVCQTLGVYDSDYACLAVLDPDAFGDSGYTK